jgi:hypothetical protein
VLEGSGLRAGGVSTTCWRGPDCAPEGSGLRAGGSRLRCDRAAGTSEGSTGRWDLACAELVHRSGTRPGGVEPA